MNDKVLELELRLLILKYGKKKVADALSRLNTQSFAEFESGLAAATTKQRAAKRNRSMLGIVEAESVHRPEVARLLRQLAIAFDNRTFLPNLRDAQRFLDRMGKTSRNFHSRESAGAAVMRLLANLPEADLVRLTAHEQPNGKSDFALLAEALMGSQTNLDRISPASNADA